MTVARMSFCDEEEIPQELNPPVFSSGQNNSSGLSKSCLHFCAVVNEKKPLIIATYFE